MKADKPRIMFVIKDLLAVGGAQVNTLRLASRLKQNGFQVMLIGYGDYRSIKQHMVRFDISTDIPIFPIAPVSIKFIKKLSMHWPNFFFIPSCFFVLWKNRKCFDIVHGPLLMESGIICALASIYLRKPSLVKIGSAGRYGDVQRALRASASVLRRVLFKRITKIVCLTKEIENELVDGLCISKHKLHIIPNGVDTNIFYPPTLEEKRGLRSKLGIPQNKKIVLYVGRLERKKRVELLLKAWNSIQNDKKICAHLLIIGSGSLRGKLEDLKDKLRISNSVTFYGQSKDIANFMRSSDLFVLPSVSEGLANTFLEAMASGLPIIATNTSGNAEILSHNLNALLFSEHSIRELADHIIFLLKNDMIADKIGLCGRKIVEDHFNIQKITSQYSNLYDNIILKNRTHQ